jgi:hypothetical protein
LATSEEFVTPIMPHICEGKAIQVAYYLPILAQKKRVEKPLVSTAVFVLGVLLRAGHGTSA